MTETTTPQSDTPTDIAVGLADSFLGGSLPFQSKESTTETPAAPVETAPEIPENETFQEQQARLGWATETAKPAETATAATPATQSAAPATPQLPGSRDYSGLPPEDVVVFKQMGNAAYAKLRPIYDQHRAFEASKGEREAKAAEQEKLINELKAQQFYGLEGAWQLDPEIKPLMEATSRLNAEAEFWQNQLVSIDRGDKIQLLKVGADGKPFVTEPLDPQPEHRAAIIRGMNDAQALYRQATAETQNAVQNFKARYQSWDQQIDTIREQTFGKFEKSLAPYRDKMLESFPQAVRHQPIYKFAADSVLVIGQLLNDITALKQKATSATLNAPARASATPSTTTTGGSGAADQRSLLAKMAEMTGIPMPK